LHANKEIAIPKNYPKNLFSGKAPIRWRTLHFPRVRRMPGLRDSEKSQKMPANPLADVRLTF
jgi:hypothetical protein